MAKTLRKILIAEDDENIGEIMKLVLEDEGYEVYQARDKKTFFSVLQKVKPHLIYLDIRLGGESGEEIADKLRSDDVTREIPFIMLSADSETAKIAKRVGANTFLAKPFDLKTLLITTKKYCL